MSHFHPEVVRLGPITHHPEADALDLTTVYGEGGYRVVVRRDEFQPGQLAVYLPMNTLIPQELERFAFLEPNYTCLDGSRMHRVKSRRLRGIFSDGLLAEVPDPAEGNAPWQEGDSLVDLWQLRYWETEEALKLEADSSAGNIVDTGRHLVKFTDMEAYQRYPDVIAISEEVCVTEKLHGSTIRLSWGDDKLWVGSNGVCKQHPGDNDWSKWALRSKIGEVMAGLPDLVLFGELYGGGGGFAYDAAGTRLVRFFDVYRKSDRRYLDSPEAYALLESLGLPTAPLLYRGPWDPALIDRWREGHSELGTSTREGVVLRVSQEREDPRIGRVILKYVSEAFKLKKSG